MATLNVYGMGTPMVVDRPLTDFERTNRLDLKKSNGTPHYELSLTRLNSTYIECVDKWYAVRGCIAMAAVVTMLILIYAGSLGYGLIRSGDNSILVWLTNGALLFIAGMSVKMFLSDAFTYTHYPIRFNRKNRQVYVFRRNGTVLKVAWEDIYWTLYGGGTTMSDIFIIGNIMDPDGITVRESFGLSVVTSGGEAGETQLRNHFEFFRLYMQEGPKKVLEALAPAPLLMLPGIDKARESWAFGWERLTLIANGFLIFQILFQVFFFPMSLFRWVVMRTSKIPQWPQWVEDECAITPDDPWIRDGRHRA